jgi:hypothetical protein
LGAKIHHLALTVTALTSLRLERAQVASVTPRFRLNRNGVLMIYAVPRSPRWVWRVGVFDAGVMGWRATDLSEDEAHEQAANLNVIFSQYGQRDQADRLEVNPPIEVESATWSAAGKLDYWHGPASGG